ncbi:phosphonate C-P lyase system protein PhnL [Mesorhizobium sp. RP14(2022)]|uniref:Phosphonate C-P lyase system protein PhnL n=1 Tax=Mesorhizobium liriopis TaxID=2953882 RepID=A0ABT1C084_9HYPH|nr:phosphonate C-P lyase system protein PhnL [Mesorhizobium liriopis]MCO6048237.1 phosphonate C-P lyase system protein PhnL [Mesorhizobium liriopis]
MTPVLELQDVSKNFTLHLRDQAEIGVVRDVSFKVDAGECVVLGGPSGIGKSSILKMTTGNYHASGGRILVRDGDVEVDVTQASPREILSLRARVIGYVSQFLRVIPRVSTLDVVAEAARGENGGEEQAREKAREMLSLLRLPEKLWNLPPATFSGGEQQRVNIARGLAASRSLLLLDEPTASLDALNRQTVVELIEQKKREGVAILGIFHDEDVRDAVASRVIDVSRFAPQPGASQKELTHA